MNKNALVLFLLSLLPLTTVEAASWYQVELLVFDRLYPELDGERWSEVEFTPRSNWVELTPADASSGSVPFMLLPTNQHRLGGIRRYFRLSSDFRPLIHVSWQQPAAGRRNAKFVHISRLNPDASAAVDNTEVAEPEFIRSLITPDRIIDGAIRIRSGFYLHIDLDLTYFKELLPRERIIRIVEEDELETPLKTAIKLKETRKIRLNEIHYFDHPMYGAIVQVSRL